MSIERNTRLRSLFYGVKTDISKLEKRVTFLNWIAGKFSLKEWFLAT
jgi:hypothetical protein